jgi:hypothetical protein
VAGRTTWMPVAGWADETSERKWLCGLSLVRSSRRQPFTTVRPGCTASHRVGLDKFYGFFVDWGKARISHLLKADDNLADQTREKSTCSLSERGNPLSTKYQPVHHEIP